MMCVSFSHLKVGSWSFECIIILLIYFLNCRRALLQVNKSVSVEKYRFKNIKLAFFARDSLTLLRTPVSAIFVYALKADNVAIVILHCILG